VTCIFCRNESDSRNIGHIVPESLGGKNSPIGKTGVTCDACNQYLGQKVEAKALQSFPFVGYKVIAGIPSKHGAMASVQASIGTIRATGRFGIFELYPRSVELGKRVGAGEVTQLRILAEVTEPLAVCRMLLKIGLELLGKHFYEVAISDRVAAACDFARRPKRGNSWWFLLRSNPEDYLLKKDDPSDSAIEIRECEGVLVTVMHLSGMSAMIPLETGTLPPSKKELSEPEYRTIWAVC